MRSRTAVAKAEPEAVAHQLTALRAYAAQNQPDGVLGLGPAADQVEARGGDGPVTPGWEAALVQIGFVGRGLGLPLALPAARPRSRRPRAFAGRLDSGGHGPTLLFRGGILSS
ncbi:hypothetical protein ACFZAR_27490 [Streptomyces sp. NPDC008222]|uniref:hypothetical protein n=1 Tax=Streptomyces sp. NPDC008222 TaxID=3364820 RepID=UPI0036F142E0